MCGRFAFYSPHEAVSRLFGVADAPAVEPRYNIAPTQFIAAVREREDRRRGLGLLYWGLVPSWSKDRAIGARMINARGETLREKPSFRSAYRRRRCLVLADGYYEWQRSGAVKQPFFISLASGEPFGMAGLWETWSDPAGGDPFESCCIVTTAPAAAVAHVHDRMPVIVDPADYAEWLDPANQSVDELDRLLVPSRNPGLNARPVSRRVNDARNQGADLVAPFGPADRGGAPP
ncbi:MAG: SOS response-associated peptidase [Steroidobacteraceae bacterium]|nr:SOS response-associated peptidase [Steroidobacteraceae bacterium]